MSGYRSIAPPMAARSLAFVSAEVLANEDLGAACRLLRLRVPEPLDALDARPGQFVMLRGPWARHPMLPRAFSVLDTAPGVLELLIKVVGRGTRLLAELQPGTAVTVLGPLGRAFPAAAPDIQDLAAGGGSGIPPLYLHALHASRSGLAHAVELLYGGRSGEDLVLADRIRAAGLELQCCTEDGSVGLEGRVTDLITARLDAPLPAPARRRRVLACGPTPMLQAVKALCTAQGVECWISLETEMACGLGICRGCSVGHPEGGWRCTCLDGAVFESSEVVL